MNILIVYATIEGQTGKIARFVQDKLSRQGHSVTLCDCDDVTDIPLEGADGVILAASVHQRRHPANFEATLSALGDVLNQHKTLFLSVSMNAAFEAGLEEAEDYALEMKMRTGLAPDKQMLVAGAIRTKEYDYFAMQVVRHVVMQGRDFDASAGEHEFTDWDGLSSGVDEFVAMLG